MFMIMKLAPDDDFHSQRGWWDVHMWIALENELGPPMYRLYYKITNVQDMQSWELTCDHFIRFSRLVNEPIKVDSGGWDVRPQEEVGSTAHPVWEGTSLKLGSAI